MEAGAIGRACLFFLGAVAKPRWGGIAVKSRAPAFTNEPAFPRSPVVRIPTPNIQFPAPSQCTLARMSKPANERKMFMDHQFLSQSVNSSIDRKVGAPVTGSV